MTTWRRPYSGWSCGRTLPTLFARAVCSSFNYLSSMHTTVGFDTNPVLTEFEPAPVGCVPDKREPGVKTRTHSQPSTVRGTNLKILVPRKTDMHSRHHASWSHHTGSRSPRWATLGSHGVGKLLQQLSSSLNLHGFHIYFPNIHEENKVIDTTSNCDI